jgi:hypothetical protein
MMAVTSKQKPKAILQVTRPKLVKLAHKVTGPTEISVQVYDGKTRKYVALTPDQVKVVEL